MGRPEQPIAEDAPYGELTAVLRTISSDSMVTLEELAERIGWSASALSKAAAGISLPSEDLLWAWARECGQPGRGEQLCQLRRELVRRKRDPDVAASRPRTRRP